MIRYTEPAPRRVTAETIELLRKYGASAELIEHAERHRDDVPRKPSKPSLLARVRGLLRGAR